MSQLPCTGSHTTPRELRWGGLDKGARGGAGNGSEDGGSSGSDGGAVGRVASERHRTPEQQVCLSLDSVCNGAPGLIAL